MDFIFGTLATDALKQVHHRASRLGVQHRYALRPASPQPGEAVTLSVWLGPDISADGVACYYTTGSAAPQGSRGVGHNCDVIRFRRTGTEWDTISWGYLTCWEVELPPQTNGTIVQYRIGVWRDGEDDIFADTPNAGEIAESAADAYFRQLDWQMPTEAADAPGKTFAYRVDTLSAPQWARDAIIYQVLVDRFYPGDGRSWIQTADVSQFMGGTLKGVIDKLGYIADLGCNTIWLSPTWPSPSAHGYDVMDYCITAEHLGGDAVLRQLVDAAHARGVRILLDMPCNHMSNQSPIFQEAQRDRSSPYRDWFTWDVGPHGYKTFFSVDSMPKINLENPATRDWMLDNARYWLEEFGIDGYRLDYASGPGADFWTFFRAACKDANPDCFCFGEVIDAPETLRSFVGRLDGCLDFYSNEALRKTYGWKTQAAAEFDRQAARHTDYFPRDFLMPTFVDNHDMNRFLHIAQGDKDALRSALAAQMKLPGPPILYYGTEIGLTHAISTQDAGLEVGRVPMIWDDRQDRRLLEDVSALLHERAAQRG